jgi:DNA invertase Pin-like site-specific DNA recombinase
MITQANQKLTADHLKRSAFLYIRQSTVQQVLKHRESTKRQYALQQRAVELGWPRARVVTIDNDQGQSGKSASDRKGFQRLVAEVATGNVGIVMGLEVACLARNNADWHRLLEICAITETLILDEDGLYDLRDFNDRLLLGLKGTISEAELHLLQSRMRGGSLSKARRGELKLPLPVGFVYNDEDKVVFDPDKQIQATIRLFFEVYRREGTGRAVVKYLRDHGLLFPRRQSCYKQREELEWLPLNEKRAVHILHNPRYAGAFAYGQKKSTSQPDGRVKTATRPREEWHALIRDAHEGYISWEEYEENQRRTKEWLQARNRDSHQKSFPPREGPALLQGLVLCGKCGKRMRVRYHHGRELIPSYVCFNDMSHFGGKMCQAIPGTGVDAAIAELLLETVTPIALDVALKVQEELERRFEEVKRVHKRQLERARYEAELSQRRYMRVDPENRLVAESLESDWNERLIALGNAEKEYEQRCTVNQLDLDEQNKRRILALATDFPRLWNDPKTSHRDRKRMVRMLIEDVTLTRVKDKGITIYVRFKGGATKMFSIQRPKRVWELQETDRKLIEQVDQLLDHHSEEEVAAILNDREFRSGAGLPLKARIIRYIQHRNNLSSRYERLRKQGKLSLEEMAKRLNVCEETIRTWRRKGKLKYCAYTKNNYLYEPPGDDIFPKMTHRKRNKSGQFV